MGGKVDAFEVKGDETPKLVNHKEDFRNYENLPGSVAVKGAGGKKNCFGSERERIVNRSLSDFPGLSDNSK